MSKTPVLIRIPATGKEPVVIKHQKDINDIVTACLCDALEWDVDHSEEHAYQWIRVWQFLMNTLATKRYIKQLPLHKNIKQLMPEIMDIIGEDSVDLFRELVGGDRLYKLIKSLIDGLKVTYILEILQDMKSNPFVYTKISSKKVKSNTADKAPVSPTYVEYRGSYMGEWEEHHGFMDENHDIYIPGQLYKGKKEKNGDKIVVMKEDLEAFPYDPLEDKPEEGSYIMATLGRYDSNNNNEEYEDDKVISE